MKRITILILIVVLALPVVSYGATGLENPVKNALSASPTAQPSGTSDNCYLKETTNLDEGYSRYKFQSHKDNGSLQQIIVTSKDYDKAMKICQLESREHGPR